MFTLRRARCLQAPAEMCKVYMIKKIFIISSRRCLHNLNLGNIPPIVFIMDDSRYRFDLLEEKLDLVKKATNETSVYDDHTDSFVTNETKA